MSSEARQRKLNQQRQKIKDNQNKKHIQQLKPIQIKDRDNLQNLNFTILKDESSPLVKSNSVDNELTGKFVYDGPQSFEMANIERLSYDEIEVYHLSDKSKTQSFSIEENPKYIEKSILIKVENQEKDSNQEIPSNIGFNYSDMKIDECDDSDDQIYLEQVKPNRNKNYASKTIQNQSDLARDRIILTESSETDLDSSANISNVAVSPINVASKQNDVRSSVDVDSIQQGNADDDNFHDSILDANLEIESFVSKPAPEDCVVKCRITRDKRGVDKGMYPTYYLHLERKNAKPLFLLAARRRKLCKTSNYLISCDATDMKKDGFGFLAKLRSNFIGTHFTLYDNGRNPQTKISVKKPLRKELAAIIFETNVLGFKGPRKMTIVIPGMTPTKTPIDFQPKLNEDDLLERCRTRKIENLLELHNKKPVWNEDSQSYVLNFHGRVTQASVKNFQIVHDNDAEYIIMQFGRTSDHSFSMDFSYPLSAIQAFGIALSSFDGKLACE